MQKLKVIFHLNEMNGMNFRSLPSFQNIPLCVVPTVQALWHTSKSLDSIE